ncbi:MAG TPA: hypothetical protein VK717_10325 [Opitutaceae bacterium]|jgi:hypothetical protein|nr:hypothetical protein [Opitutaceae bacterium]
MKMPKTNQRTKRFHRVLVLKISSEMLTELRRLYGRRVGAKIRELITANVPSLNDKSPRGKHSIKANAPIFEAARMLAGTYASLRELQKLVSHYPLASLTLVHADLSEALSMVEAKLREVCTLLAAERKAEG